MSCFGITPYIFIVVILGPHRKSLKKAKIIIMIKILISILKFITNITCVQLNWIFDLKQFNFMIHLDAI